MAIFKMTAAVVTEHVSAPLCVEPERTWEPPGSFANQTLSSYFSQLPRGLYYMDPDLESGEYAGGTYTNHSWSSYFMPSPPEQKDAANQSIARPVFQRVTMDLPVVTCMPFEEPADKAGIAALYTMPVSACQPRLEVTVAEQKIEVEPSTSITDKGDPAGLQQSTWVSRQRPVLPSPTSTTENVPLCRDGVRVNNNVPVPYLEVQTAATGGSVCGASIQQIISPGKVGYTADGLVNAISHWLLLYSYLEEGDATEDGYAMGYTVKDSTEELAVNPLIEAWSVSGDLTKAVELTNSFTRVVCQDHIRVKAYDGTRAIQLNVNSNGRKTAYDFKRPWLHFVTARVCIAGSLVDELFRVSVTFPGAEVPVSIGLNTGYLDFDLSGMEGCIGLCNEAVPGLVMTGFDEWTQSRWLPKTEK